MPKISQIAIDQAVDKGDKLLGSDAGGGTRNYRIEDISKFIKDTNAAGVVGQYPYIYYNSAFGGKLSRPSGSITIDTYNDTFAFADVTTIKFSNKTFANNNVIDEALLALDGRTLVISSNSNQNNFGIYTCSDVSQDPVETDFYDVSLTAISTNGSFVDGELYSVLNSVVSESASSETSFTTALKNKLEGIEEGAEVNVQSDWNATSGDALILNKPTIPTDNSELTNGAGYITDGNTNWNNTYGFITEETDTLDSVTSRGNTTTDDIEVGGLHVNGDFTNYNKNATDIGQVQTSDARGYGLDYVSEKTLAYCRIGASAFDEEGAVRIKDNVFQTYMNGAWQDVVTNFRFREDENGDYELEHKPVGFDWWIEVNSGNSDNLGLNGLPIVQNYKVSMGAYPVPLEIDGGTF